MEVQNQSTGKYKRLQQGQGLAEYSLILSLIAVVCVAILIVLGRATKTTFQKANCSIPGSTDPQCSCINEQLTVTSTYPNGCSGSNLIVTVASSCSGATVTVNGQSRTTPGSFTWNSAPVCTGAATTFNVQTSLPSPYNSSNSYQASRP